MARRIIANTAIPYRSYSDITSDAINLVSGSQNLLTSARQLMERRPGFADSIEASPTTFTSVARHVWFIKWGGTDVYSIVNDISGGASKIYKLLLGTDANYVLIFTSASAVPFDFAISGNALYMGNGTDMRKYLSGASTKTWGGSAPASAPTIGTTGTGISAFSGWYYVSTYEDSTDAHETSASDLSACTGIVSNKTIQVTLVASSNSRFDRIRLYRTTDGGSTDPTVMREITGSPFTNANQTINDTTTDVALGDRTAPGFTTNDPPAPSSKLSVSADGSRIFTATSATSYFSALEELPSNGVPQECFPSGLGGNSYPWPQEVTAQAPMADGIAVFTRGKIWKIAGDRRDNYIRGGLLDRRGAISATAVASLGNSVAWLDTSSQVFMDGDEVGFDIRNDIQNIDHSQAYMAIHVSGKFHWLCLLDGASGKLYVYDLDTQQWLPPWTLPAAASALSSGEKSSGTVTLTCALSKTKTYNLNTSSYTDGSSPYSAVAIINLMKLAGGEESPAQPFTNIVVETDANTASLVSYLLDEDPTSAGAAFTDISNHVSDPTQREQGVNLVKKIYEPEGNPKGERISAKVVWPTTNQAFTCYTLTMNDAMRGA